MLPEPLADLRSELAARGFSTRYIQRLCDELQDHVHTAAESEQPSGAVGQEDVPASIVSRLGTPCEIAQAVVDRPELGPFVVRRPVVAMVLVPGLSVWLLGWLLMGLAWWLANAGGTAGLAPWFPPIYLGLAMILPVAAGAVFYGLGRWFGVPPHYVWASVCLLSLFGVYTVELVPCAATETTFFRVTWEISLWRLAAPWLGVFIFSGLSPSGLARKPVRFSLCRRDFGIAVLGAVTCAGLVVTSVITMRHWSAAHPADPYVRGINDITSIGTNKIRLLRRPDVREILQLSNHQVVVLEQSLSAYDSALAKAAAIANPEGKSTIPWNPDWSREHVVCFLGTIDSQFDSKQRRMLDGLAYRELGADALLLDSVQRRLRCRESQRNQIKDLIIERLRVAQAAWREISLADGPVRPTLRANMNDELTAIDDRIFAVLTHHQARTLREMTHFPQPTE